MVSITMQKILSFIGSYLFVFAFNSFALGDWSKKKLSQFISENALPVFSPGSFMMSCFIFRSLNHFGYIFIYGVWDNTNFTDLHVS